MRGELPPPPPGIFFGRDGLIEEIVRLAGSLTSIALIGAGGIGKTSIALVALHNDRIKQRFGENRRFIRCDEFLPTHNQFLRRLSKAIGAEIENPENLAVLRQSLASKEMFIILDNAESILDPEGPSAREIYADVDELARSSNICLLVTSRISTVPPDCETFEIPTLSLEAACGTFHRIYKHGGRSTSTDSVLEQLEFHPLSITLLATVGQQNKWSTDRLVAEWSRQRTAVLNSKHSGSLAATVELSLTSPMFQELGPDAREFLEAVAFFPQGVNEKNVSWLFPTIPEAPRMLDEFCVLSLTYRNGGFVTMLAPLRDHLRPQNPTLSPLLSTTKECYFTRLSGDIHPGKLGFEEARWIMSEDVNVEHLLDVFTTIDGTLTEVWDACSRFMAQLYWHKLRLVTLGPKIEALPDDHPSKAQCLFHLSRLFDSVGNWVEEKRLLNGALKLRRGQGDDLNTARTLSNLSDINRVMGLNEEGIQQAEEASQVFKRLGDPVQQAWCLASLAFLLLGDEQLDAAEETALRAIDLLPEEGEQLRVYNCHLALGEIYGSKGKTEKAIHHFEIALRIASALNQVEDLFKVHHDLAELFYKQGRFSDARIHIEHAKTVASNNKYHLACVSVLQARLWYKQNMFGEAKSEALAALDVLEKLGSDYADAARHILQLIDARLAGPSGRSRRIGRRWQVLPGDATCRALTPRFFRCALSPPTIVSSAQPPIEPLVIAFTHHPAFFYLLQVHPFISHFGIPHPSSPPFRYSHYK